MSGVTDNYGLITVEDGEAYDPNIFNSNNRSIDALLKELDKRAKGNSVQSTVTTSSGSSVDAIVNNFASFTFKAGRKYRIVWDFSYWASGNSDSLFYCSINFAPVADIAALLTNLELQHGRTKGLYTAYALQSSQHTGPVTSYYNPTVDRTVQVKFRVQRVYGDDGIIISANANEPAIYSIYDDGAQF
jgi:hypothetical protein